MAFLIKFRNTCFSWSSSASMRGKLGSYTCWNRPFFRINVSFSNIKISSSTLWIFVSFNFSSTGFDSSIILLTNELIRSTSLTITSRYSRWVFFFMSWRNNWAEPRMPPRGFLISWASPIAKALRLVRWSAGRCCFSNSRIRLIFFISIMTPWMESSDSR